MSRVLITGGAGFIGSHLVEALVDRAVEVVVYDQLPWERVRNLANVRHCIRYVQGDIRDERALGELIDGGLSCIYHLASIVGVRHYVADPLAVVDVIVGGTRGVLGLARRHGVKTVIASTSEVFGKNPAVPWEEEADRVLGSTTVDRWSYASAKGVCEHMAFALARLGHPVGVVRFFNAYGPRQAPDYVISQTIWKVLRGEPPLLYDGGAQTRCFTYVEDIVQGVMTVGGCDEANGQSFNLGNPVETSVQHVVEQIIDLAGADVLMTPFETELEYGDRYEDIPRRVPSVGRAAHILGWRARTPLEEGLAKTIGWARANQWWLEIPDPALATGR
jgi:dTDP-alpha-D-glucuronic acid decarboxylase